MPSLKRLIQLLYEKKPAPPPPSRRRGRKKPQLFNMKTIVKNQTDFIDRLDSFGVNAWNEKFDYLVELSDLLPSVCPGELYPYRVAACQSRTYFTARIEGGRLRVDGWSNTPVQRGIIVSVIEMFDRTPAAELTDSRDVFFHEKSGLVNNLTPLRKEGLKEMVNRIRVLCRETEE